MVYLCINFGTHHVEIKFGLYTQKFTKYSLSPQPSKQIIVDTKVIDKITTPKSAINSVKSIPSKCKQSVCQKSQTSI